MLYAAIAVRRGRFHSVWHALCILLLPLVRDLNQVAIHSSCNKSNQARSGESFMIATNKKRIRCMVLAVPIDAEAWSSRGAIVQELVPDADPYIAQLIKRLQDEVREERHAHERQRRERLMLSIHTDQELPATKPRFSERQLQGDLEIPWFDMPEDETWEDEAAPEVGDRSDDTTPAW
jgi:hypothetical protein